LTAAQQVQGRQERGHMLRILGAAAVGAVVLASLSAPAFAQSRDGFTANAALVSDYKFRGISQTSGNPAIQGGFDYTHGLFYAGTWASSVDFTEVGAGAGIELDLYGGIRPTLGPASFDLGLIGYFYPGVTDVQGPGGREGELDYGEVYARASITPMHNWGVGASAYYSPEFGSHTGKAYYVEANTSYAFDDHWSASGAVGYQHIGDVTGVFPSSIGDGYATWNAGVSYSTHGFTIDLRYVGTDIDRTDPIIAQGFTTYARVNDGVILSIKRAF
jgi:uncharacterized protein (TIGR02001 family)